MKKIIGEIDLKNENFFISQENGKVSLVNSKNIVKPKNYDLIKNRDKIIGNEKVTGETVFNFRYGPVTGGVAEAGIYNIYTTGEKILSVSIDLSYKKRHIEKSIIGAEPEQAIKYAEAVCGNFAFSHSLAFTRAIENISDITVNSTIKNYRVAALELERIYNHFYVITELAKGAAQKVFTSHMQYLFEECLRINELFSNSRHLLGFNKICGVSKELSPDIIKRIEDKLDEIENRFALLYSKSLESGNYLDRLHNTGIIRKEHAEHIGLTGPSLRAAGVKEDLREFDSYYENITVPVKNEGDSLARMEVRGEEVFISIKILKDKLLKLRDNPHTEKTSFKIKDGNGYFASESPSGTICYFISVRNGTIEYCYIVTPSLFGFQAIADSLAGQIFTDFVFTIESFGVNFADAAR